MTTPETNILEERTAVAHIAPGLLQWFSPFRWVQMLTGDARELYRTRFVLRNLVITQLKIRYHRSALGFFWTLLNPALMLTVQAVVFSQLVPKSDRYPYAVYLFAGFVPWQFFMSSIDNGSRSLLSSEGLIRKVAAPKLIFPLADTIVCLINMVFAMTAMFAIFLFIWPHLYWQLMLIPIGTLLLGAFTIGLVFISMSMATFFRDFLHLIPIFLQAWYFASPIIYPREALSEAGLFRALLDYNPMTHFISFFQHAILGDASLDGPWPSNNTWIIASTWAIGMLLVGYATYKRLEHDYIFRL